MVSLFIVIISKSNTPPNPINNSSFKGANQWYSFKTFKSIKQAPIADNAYEGRP
jgi:hypothetical protein